MTFKPYHDPASLYFITATVLGWKQLFARPAYAQFVLDSLIWHRQHGRWALYAWVLMPNHLHAIIKPLGDQTISSVLQSFGSFTAHMLLEHLKREQHTELLAFFAERQDKDAQKAHQIWQPIQAKNVTSIEFLREKLDYIHNNPVAKKWNLAAERAAYAYSSACYYDRDVEPLVAVDDIREWLA
jgi:putative transposase